jgi:hypothetical protein
MLSGGDRRDVGACADIARARPTLSSFVTSIQERSMSHDNDNDNATRTAARGAGSIGRTWRAGPSHQQGRWGYILAWALGVPIPILILVYLLRGCT